MPNPTSFARTAAPCRDHRFRGRLDRDYDEIVAIIEEEENRRNLNAPAAARTVRAVGNPGASQRRKTEGVELAALLTTPPFAVCSMGGTRDGLETAGSVCAAG